MYDTMIAVDLAKCAFVTEDSAATSHIVTSGGELVTRDLSHALLPDITRASVLDLAAAHGIRIKERAFTPDAARAAREAFITSATNFVMPVIAIGGAAVSDGKPGEQLGTCGASISIPTARRQSKERNYG